MTLYNIHEQQFSNLSSFLLRAHNRNPPQKTLSPIPKFPARWFFNFLIFFVFFVSFFRKERRCEQVIVIQKTCSFRSGWRSTMLTICTHLPALKGCSCFPYCHQFLPVAVGLCISGQKWPRAMSADRNPAPAHTLYICIPIKVLISISFTCHAVIIRHSGINLRHVESSCSIGLSTIVLS